MDINQKKALLNFFQEFITPERKKLFKQVLQQRTRHITILLEDIYQPHNASAVLRTCDLTGVQDVHIIETRNEYNVNPDVALGSSKWLNLVKYNQKEHNTLNAYNKLRKRGYRIVATTPNKNAYTPETIPLEGKVALVFGTELNGLTDEAMDHADEYLRIPMYGFTESFNISVSAALVLYALTSRLRNSEISWQLDSDERTDILLEWSRRSIKKSDALERQFFRSLNS